MPVACPSCGQEVTVTEREVTVQAGACPGCSREVVVWSGPSGTAPAEAPEELVPSIAVTHQDGDDDCDGTLSLAVGEEGRLVGTCSDCGAEFIFTLERPGAPGGEVDSDEGPEEEDEEAPAPRPSFGRPPRDREGTFADRGRPPGRPCRRCGGVLRFETGDDGVVTGTCTSCGNTFSLPPRRDDRSRGPPRGGGFRPGGYSGRRGGGGGYGGGYGGRPAGGRRPPYRRRDDREESDDRPRRRRRE